MTVLIFILCAAPVFVLLFRLRNIRINAFWFVVFHFFVYVLVGLSFPGPDVSDSIRFLSAAIGLFVFVAFSLGFLFSYSLVGGDFVGTRLNFDFHRVLTAQNQRAIIILVIFTTLIGILFFQGLPPVIYSLGSIVAGGFSIDHALEVRDFRYVMTKSAYFGGESRGQGFFRVLIFTNCAIISSYFAFRYAVMRSRSAIWGLVFALIFSFIFVGGVGDRGPFLEIVLITVAAFSLVRPIKLQGIMWGGLALFALLFLMSSLSTKGFYHLQNDGISGLVGLGEDLIDRVFRGNSKHDIAIITLVESGAWPLRWGEVHLRNFITSLPGVNYGVPVSYELFAYFNPGSTRSTFFSGTYLSHTFLDFGLFGSVIVYFVSGCLVAMLSAVGEAWFRNSIERLVLPIWYFTLGQVVVSGIPGLLPSIFVLVMMVLFIRAARLRRLSFLRSGTAH